MVDNYSKRRLMGTNQAQFALFLSVTELLYRRFFASPIDLSENKLYNLPVKFVISASNTGII